MARREYQKARKIYERALIFRDDNPDLHYGLASVCFLLNDLQSAVQHFKEVLRMDSLHANAYINLGAVYDRLGQFDDSLEALKNGILLDPERAEGHYNIALVHKHAGDPDKAIAAYREAIRLRPRMYEAHYNLGNVLFEKHLFDQAIIHYRDALELRPDCAKTQKALASAQAESQSGKRQPAPTGETTSPKLDLSMQELEQTLHPKRHHGQLTELHNLAVDINKDSSALLDVLKNQVEVSIQELSERILASKESQSSLESQLAKFNEMVVTILRLHESLDGHMARAKSLSQDMVRVI